MPQAAKSGGDRVWLPLIGQEAAESREGSLTLGLGTKTRGQHRPPRPFYRRGAQFSLS